MTSLIGHDDEIAALVAAARSGRLHHGWLLSGPEGVGKALFAGLAARWLLAMAAGEAGTGDDLSVDPAARTALLFNAAAHPDFRLLERPPRDRKERDKPLDKRDPDAERARNIPIDDVRMLNGFFALAPTYSTRRVVIIDAVDDLERPAANALLKTLEEPPPDTVFLLVNHAPGRLLPTIRSRCRTLRFAGLGEADMVRVIASALPDVAAGERDALIAAGAGSPGRALRFAGLGLDALEATMRRLAEQGDPHGELRLKLASGLGGKAGQERFEALLDRAPALAARYARQRRGEALAEAVEVWEALSGLSAGATGLSLDPQAVAYQVGSLLTRLAPRRSPA